MRATLRVVVQIFCLVPRVRDEVLFECGGAKVYRVAGSAYLDSTRKKTMRPGRWNGFTFQMCLLKTLHGKVLLPSRLHPPKKQYNCCPRTQS